MEKRGNEPKKKVFFGLRMQLVVAFVVFAALMLILVGMLFRLALEQQAVQMANGLNLSDAWLSTVELNIDHQFNALIWQNMVPLTLVLVLAGIGGALLGFFLSHPLHSMSEAVQSIEPESMKKSGLRLTRRGHKYFRDEIDDMLDAFNRLYSKVDEHTQTLHALVDERTRALTHSNETLRDFVYYTAHRLRTPLNVMRWSADVLKSEEPGRLNARQREVVSDLESALVSVIELTDDLQDSLMIEKQNKVSLQTELVDLRDVIDAAAGDVAVLARERTVSIEWRRPRSPIKGYVNRSRVTQALKNVLENAILYNVENGKVQIDLSFANQVAPPLVRKHDSLPDTRRPFVYLSVADTGIGIPPDEREQVFGRFFRGRMARTKWVDGGGIGLSVTRAAILLHGGAIWFTENPGGKGTMFILSLPIEK